ncbi:MAG: lytic murein transglycosylase [Desulfococcaceae bacterium]
MIFPISSRRIRGLAVALAGLGLLLPATAATRETDYFAPLQTWLVRDGFSSRQLAQLYARPEAEFEYKGVSSYFVHRESKLNYGQFLEPGPLDRAWEYMRRHEAAMTRAAESVGVDREVIAAILLVETRLGAYVGSPKVFNILSSMAALEDRSVRDAVWTRVQGDTRLSRNEFDAKANQKGRWAYGELKAFLRYAASENLDPLSIVGSYAGAMGYCQFMPSNISKYARDGNGDGRIDLFDHADAIMSVASYLSNFGWRPGANRERQYKAVHAYNHSKYYVNTVLAIADKLRG